MFALHHEKQTAGFGLFLVWGGMFEEGVYDQREVVGKILSGWELSQREGAAGPVSVTCLYRCPGLASGTMEAASEDYRAHHWLAACSLPHRSSQLDQGCEVIS